VKGKARHHLQMHPDDLRRRGIGDGSRVRLRSRVGSIETEVRASDQVMSGSACLPHGFGHQRDFVRLSRARDVAGESYNDLSDPRALDGPSGNAALNGLAVWVEALG
jgi:anaerobic selenocysteine-containing dehydrogenase